MTLDQVQENVDEFVTAHGGYWDEFQILARLTEELGEVASALQRNAGLRPRKVEVDLEGEVGDLLFTIAAFANKTGIRLDEAMVKVMAKYQERDSKAWQDAAKP